MLKGKGLTHFIAQRSRGLKDKARFLAWPQHFSNTPLKSILGLKNFEKNYSFCLKPLTF
jgi:hypothetical protein